MRGHDDGGGLFSATQGQPAHPLGTDARDITLAGWSYETVLQDGVTCLKLSNPAGFSGKQQFTCSYTLPVPCGPRPRTASSSA